MTKEWDVPIVRLCEREETALIRVDAESADAAAKAVQAMDDDRKDHEAFEHQDGFGAENGAWEVVDPRLLAVAEVPTS